MPKTTLDNQANRFPSSDEVNLSGKDTVVGGEGNDRIVTGSNDDILYGEADNDGLFGNGGQDYLLGQRGDDILKGGDGYDRLEGGPDNDILYGQTKLNSLVGGSGNDTLIGLGNAENQDNLVQDSPSTAFPDRTIKIVNETMRGGPGADEFRILKNLNLDGEFFTNGQKYVVIKDFKPTKEQDKIVLPGSPDDYRADFFGDKNQGTAIFYTADPGIDLGFSVLGVSLGTDFTANIPTEAALVAIIENTTARNMYNESFYEYTGS